MSVQNSYVFSLIQACKNWPINFKLSRIIKVHTSNLKHVYFLNIFHTFFTFYLTLTDRAPLRTLIDRDPSPPSISETIIDREPNLFSSSSCVFIEKKSFYSHGGQTAPQALFSGQPPNIKTAVELILKIWSSNSSWSFIYLLQKIKGLNECIIPKPCE